MSRTSGTSLRFTQKNIIDAHDDNVSDMEGKVHDSSIVYVRPDGTAEKLMYLPTGLTLIRKC